MERSGRFFSASGSGIYCELCPAACLIPSGSFGACKVRGNTNGRSLIPFYGKVTAMACDPIEKKPLYHYCPGSQIFSVGFTGCNFCCPFCQNSHISQSAQAPGRYMPPEELVRAVLKDGSQAIAYTYSEPLVHIEYLLDCMTQTRRHGIANVLVTNGCINKAAAAEVLSLTDAANIDLKCFCADTYTNILGGAPCGSSLDAVLAFIRFAVDKSVHAEITTLVVPGLNDSVEELDAIAGFIACLHESSGAPPVPWHLSAYRPEYRWNAPPTNPGFLLQMKERAGRKLPYVYTGNIQHEVNDTHCLHCRALLVRRRGYRTDIPGLASASGRYYRCVQCGTETGIRN